MTGTISVSGGTVGFTGTGAQTIPAYNYNNLTSSSTGSRTLANSGTIGIAGTFIPGTNTYTITGSTADYNASSAQTIAGFNYNNLTLSNGGIKTFSSGTTGTAGTLVITGSATSDAITNNSTISYNGSANQTVTPLTYYNLDVTSAGIVTAPATLNINGNLLLNTGTFIAGTTINIIGNWTNNGGTFTPGTNTVIFDGTGAQSISGTAASQTFDNVIVSKPGGTLLSIGGSTITLTTNDFTETTGNFTAPATLNINGNLLLNPGTFTAGTTINIKGNWTNNGGTFSPGTNAVVFNGTGAQLIAGSSGTTFNNLTVSGSNTVTSVVNYGISSNLLLSSGTLDLGNYTADRISTGGTLTISSGATLKIGGTNTLPSNYSTHSIGATSTIEYSGTNQSLAALNSSQDYGNLNVSGSGTKTLTGNVNIAGTLTFTGATITTGASTLYLKPGGTVSRTSGHVIGNFKKNVATGATSKTFETGDAINYTPVTVAFASVTTAGDLTASVTATDHPNLVGSGIRTDKSVNRYLTLANSSIVFTNATLTMNWVAGDIDPGSTTANFKVGNYNNPTWTLPSVASPLATSIQATGLTSFGDFAVGELCVLSSGFSYTASPYCSNGGTATPTITGTAGTFTSTAGLSINSVTGAVNLAASTAGAYVVTNSATSAGGCASSSTANITITALPSATISYTGSPYCSNGATGTVTRTGTTGGTYTSTAGLTINSGTGAITLGTSTAGTYTVTYTIPAVGGCSAQTATTPVTLTAAPSATISYSGSPFCISPGTGQPVTQTGTTGGTYSSTAGLTINSGTGVITPGTSTEGTYTVTYTMVTGGCITPATISVTVIAAPSAIISYPGSPYCSSGTATVSQTGTAGGIYSSTTGLTIDSSTGDINLNTCTPGSYTVTYTIAASGSCSQYQTTASLTIVTPGTWSGAVSTAWNASGNWLCGAIPTATTNVTIPGSLTNYPILNTGTGSVQNITIQSGASLTVTGATLQIAGSISNSGTFCTSNGIIEMRGSSSQIIPANIFQNNAVNNLIVSNTSAGGVTLSGALDVYGSLTYSGTGMKLTTNDALTLKSTATNTAWIGDMTGNTITGKVTVERYISAHKAWRFLSIPTNTTQTVKQTWQEGCGANLSCNANFGIQITGAGGTAAGFDVYTSTPSMKTYNSATNSWVGIANTNTATIKATDGYMTFIRGDRTANAFNSTPTQTVLRTKGSLYTGDQAPIPVSAGKFAAIGNPYASALDMRNYYQEQD